jgi:hypothetical protein
MSYRKITVPLRGNRLSEEKTRATSLAAGGLSPLVQDEGSRKQGGAVSRECLTHLRPTP